MLPNFLVMDFTIMHPDNTVVAQVRTSRVVIEDVEDVEEEEEGEEGAEGETAAAEGGSH
jgi:large subunit ribosomal protein L25